MINCWWRNLVLCDLTMKMFGEDSASRLNEHCVAWIFCSVTWSCVHIAYVRQAPTLTSTQPLLSNIDRTHLCASLMTLQMSKPSLIVQIFFLTKTFAETEHSSQKYRPSKQDWWKRWGCWRPRYLRGSWHDGLSLYSSKKLCCLSNKWNISSERQDISCTVRRKIFHISKPSTTS